jgi:uncharacterized protein YxeA
MKSILVALVILGLAVSVFAAVETWKNVTLIDAMCAGKMKDNPDAHTTECTRNCTHSGLGILTADGTFLKFDEAGQQQAVAALKDTKKKHHLRVTVTGERVGDTIQVQSLKLD